MLAMTREDVAWYQSQVIVTVARQIEVPEYEFYMSFELYDMIRDRNPSVFKNLETFLEAPSEWWKFQEAHEAELSTGGFTPENLEKNINLMNKRDSTRQGLIDSVKK
jgi:hypothetical protein